MNAIAVVRIAKVFKKMNFIWNRYFRNFLIIIICAHFCFLFYEQIIFTNQTNRLDAFYSMIFLSIIVFVSIYQFYRLEIDSLNKINEMMFYQEILSLQQQFKGFEEQNIKMKIFKHDMENIFLTASHYLEKRDWDKLDKIINLKQDELSSFNTMTITGITLIDIILNTKKEESISKGIDFFIRIKINSLHNIDEYEFSLLLANALNNAIENIGEEKKINLNIKEESSNIYIKLIDSVNNNVLINNPILRTSKIDTINHGFGIESMRRVVSKYNGNINFKCNDTEFILFIRLGFQANDF